MENTLKSLKESLKDIFNNEEARTIIELEFRKLENELKAIQNNTFVWKGKTKYLNIVNIDDLLGVEK